MLIVGAMSLVVGVILLICCPIGRRRNARCTARAQGTLRDIRARYNSNGFLPDTHVFSYTVDGTEYQLKSSSHSPEAERVGDECTIWYNPARPEEAQVVHYESDRVFKIILLAGIALLLLGIILVCVGFYQQFIK